MCMGIMFDIAKNDALAKARGEPTRGFHDIQPNYNNPIVMAAVADKKAGRSTTFPSTGSTPNIWQQYADSYAASYKAPVKKPKQQTPKEDSAPPVLRNDISTSASNLGVSKRSSATKQGGGTGRRTSKAKRFSTRSK